MRARRLAQAVGAVVLVLASFAVVFDDVAFARPAVVLALFLVFRAFLFDRRLRTALAAASVERVPDGSMVRQGSIVGVRSRFTVPARGLRVACTDLPPAGATVAGGSCTAACAGPTGTATYRLLFSGRGTMEFSGIAVDAADEFFEGSITLSGDDYRRPAIWVFPLVDPVRAEGTGYGPIESDLRPGIAGQTVQSFREFADGDDPRLIDWKLSAKYDRLYAREYGSLRGSPPVVLVDLPEREESADPGAFARLAKAAAAMAEGSLHDYRFCSLLVLSGGNVYRYLPVERDGRKVAAALGELAPAERHRQLFRALDRTFAVNRISRLERDAGNPSSGGSERAFARAVARRLGAFSGQADPDDFGTILSRALVPFAGGEVHVFSLCTGDTSHLSALFHAARRQRIATILHVPQEAATPETISRLGRIGLSRVEVLG